MLNKYKSREQIEQWNIVFENIVGTAVEYFSFECDDNRIQIENLR